MNFNEKVYKLCSKIPRGKVSTYKELAKALNSKAYRAVGNALRNNKYPNIIPCFRVIKNDGSIGGYCGKNPKNIKKKIFKLKLEGIIFNKGKIDMDKYLYKFK
ncbi:MAG: MGMT family protein [Nanoarchaeota archaeon]